MIKLNQNELEFTELDKKKYIPQFYAEARSEIERLSRSLIEFSSYYLPENCRDRFNHLRNSMLDYLTATKNLIRHIEVSQSLDLFVEKHAKKSTHNCN